MSMRNSPSPAAFQALACLALVVQPGCMSALTSAGLREAVFDTIDSLAASAAGDAPAPAADADVSARVATDAADAGADDAAEPAVEPARVLSLDEAVERAVNRLNGRGRLDAETQATLLAILDATSPEDWPAAIDAFTASLESRRTEQRSAEGAARGEVAAREPPGKLVVVEVSRPVPPVAAPVPAVAPENPPHPSPPSVPRNRSRTPCR
ncbi:MAG: hypothetical protein EBZ74_11845 [Planctomycetia bacterium]|nr:hypothetical protein [Planctomycetia bacterium]